jgi:hypoxanthine-guanine phosphoribosyltransferase
MCERERDSQRPTKEKYEELGIVTKLDDLPIIQGHIPNLQEDERIFLLHTQEEVEKRVKDVGSQILEDYEGVEDLAVLIIREGGKRFAEELLTYLESLNPLVASVRLKSYTEENQQKEVEQLSSISTVIRDFDGNERKVDISSEEFKGHRWLIIDDVIDEISTIRKAKNLLTTGGAEDIRVVTMFNKNAFDVPDYYCFQAYWKFWLVGGNMGKGDDFTTLPTGPLSIGVYSKTE